MPIWEGWAVSGRAWCGSRGEGPHAGNAWSALTPRGSAALLDGGAYELNEHRFCPEPTRSVRAQSSMVSTRKAAVRNAGVVGPRRD